MNRRRLSLKQRRAIIEAQNGLCAMCGDELVPGHYDFDHIQDLQHSGDNAPDNWQALCKPCHWLKTKRGNAARLKADRIALGGRERKGPPMCGSRLSKFRRRMDGRVERR